MSWCGPDPESNPEPDICIDCGYNPPCEVHLRMSEEAYWLGYVQPDNPIPAHWGKEHPSKGASHIRQR